MAVAQVAPGSSAAMCGCGKGMVFLSVGGVAVASEGDLLARLRESEACDELDVTFRIPRGRNAVRGSGGVAADAAAPGPAKRARRAGGGGSA